MQGRHLAFSYLWRTNVCDNGIGDRKAEVPLNNIHVTIVSTHIRVLRRHIYDFTDYVLSDVVESNSDLPVMLRWQCSWP